MTGAYHGLGGIFSPPAFLIVLSQLILTCAAIFHEEYVPTRWQVFLLYEFWNIVALLLLLYGSRILPLLSALACKLIHVRRATQTDSSLQVVFLAGGLFLTLGLLLGFTKETAPAQ
jgi:choline transport protein